MERVTTAEIVARRALGMSCGAECVDWAVGLLAAGVDTVHLRRLAGIVPPYNEFEIAALLDKALDELSESAVSRSAAMTLYARSRLRAALQGDADLIHEVRTLAELCCQSGYADELYDFYNLQCAYDLPGADPTEVTAKIRDFALAFVRQRERHST
jgi:hypothetical protein